MRLESFREKVLSLANVSRAGDADTVDVDDKIALGVLLWVMGAVAEADGGFLPEEAETITDILIRRLKTPGDDASIVLTAVRQAAIGNFDVYELADEAGKRLPYDTRMLIIEDLFRIACADKLLDDREFEVIKKASDLFQLKDGDLSDIEKKAKDEFDIK